MLKLNTWETIQNKMNIKKEVWSGREGVKVFRAENGEYKKIIEMFFFDIYLNLS